MKKIILSLAFAFVALSSVSAMSYEEARRQALFLTDKMAYELNLNEQQYEDCYEINLDYLLSVQTADDAYGHYLAYRNADLRHILLDWQYTLFAAADYFLHPLYWHRGVWHYPIYRYYAVDRFFYGRPHVYFSYRGGHGRFHYVGGFYGDRRPHHWGGGFRGMDRGAVVHRDAAGHRGGGYHIGGGRQHDTGHQHDGGRQHGGGYHIGDGRHTGGHASLNYTHPSSTRTTVHNGHDNGRGGYSVGRSQNMHGSTRSGSISGSSSRAGGFSGSGSRSSGFSGGSRGGGSPQHHGSRGGSSRGGR